MVVTNKKKPSFKKSLKVACIGLIGSLALSAQAQTNKNNDDLNNKPVIETIKKDNKKWFFNSAILYYSETDRVTAIEPVIAAKRIYDDGDELNLKLVFDSLTGSSHNGASPADSVQTFTTPSGNSSYTAAPGEIPLDETFRDTRVAISSSWTDAVNKSQKNTYGLNISSEYDYLSISANFLLAKEFNNKNTTWTTGLSYAADEIEPEGGIPIPLASMVGPGPNQPREGTSDTKDTIDFITGITQIINPSSLFQLNYSLSLVDGYMTDPFKLVSIVDPVSGAPVDYIYESRPDTRTKHALYFEYKKHLERDIVNASYRYMTDDWGIDSHTLDFRYFYFLNDKEDFIRPSIRIYKQGEADFYSHSFTSNNKPTKEASGDHRLGNMLNYSIGLKYQWNTSEYRSWAVKIEYYKQTMDEVPGSGVGEQKKLDLNPDLDAYIFQLTYNF